MPPSELAMILDAAIAKEGVGGVMPVAIGLGAVTGARRGELCVVRWSDLGSAVGTADAEFAIARSLARLIGQTPILGPTKTHAERSVAIGAAGRDILVCRLEKQARYAEHARTALRPDAFVLPVRPTGRRLAYPMASPTASPTWSRACGLGPSGLTASESASPAGTSTTSATSAPPRWWRRAST